jgi:small subunit ribosomal protein S2
MAQVTMSQLLKAGVHFGHQTRRWNPKMKRYILMERNGIHIIDLFQTLGCIDKAYDFIKQTVAHNGTILFVGTKKQAQEAISKQATRVGMPYVNQRWLGGMLTNFQTVSKRVSRMKELDDINFDDTKSSGLTKKELLLLHREKDKLDKELGGIRNMSRTPSALFVVDINKEALAVDEARKLNIPVVALVDTNTDPDLVTYPIPANDDAIRGINLLVTLMADAVADGLLERDQNVKKSVSSDDQKNASTAKSEQPMAEWEKNLLQKGGSAATASATAAVAQAASAQDNKNASKNQSSDSSQDKQSK